MRAPRGLASGCRYLVIVCSRRLILSAGLSCEPAVFGDEFVLFFSVAVPIVEALETSGLRLSPIANRVSATLMITVLCSSLSRRSAAPLAGVRGHRRRRSMRLINRGK